MYMACDRYNSKQKYLPNPWYKQNMEEEASKLLEGIKERIFMTSGKEYIFQEESKKRSKKERLCNLTL